MRPACIAALVAFTLVFASPSQPAWADFHGNIVRMGIGIIQQQQRQIEQQRHQQRHRQSRPRQSKRQQPEQSARALETREAQSALNSLGFDAGPVDGIAGGRTRAALAAFETAYGFPADGRLDPEVLGALRFAVRRLEDSNRPPGAATAQDERQLETFEQGSPGRISSFDPGPSAPSAGGSVAPAELVFVDGRLVSGSLVEHSKAGFSSFDNFDRAVLNLVVPQVEPADIPDEGALAFFDDFTEEAKAAIREIAFGRPLTEREKLPTLGDRFDGPFGERRAAAAIRERLHARFPGDATSNPLPLRVYCEGRLGYYDFDRNGFHLQSDCSFPRIDQRALKNLGVMFTVEATPGVVMPDLLLMPAAEAEAFAKERHREPLLLSFESELSLSIRETEAEPVATFSFAPPSGVALHPEGDLAKLVRATSDNAFPGMRGGTPADLTAEAARSEEPPVAAAHSAPNPDLVLPDLVFIDGRLVAMPRYSAPSLEPPLDPHENLRDAVLEGVLPQVELPAASEININGIFQTFDVATRKAIMREALQRPLDGARETVDGDMQHAVLSYDAFAMSRAREAVRRELQSRYAEAGLTSPLPLLVLCQARIGRYDFDASAFPLETPCTQPWFETRTLDNLGINVVVEDMPASPLPDQVPVPQGEAEAFYLDHQGETLLLSYETEIGFHVSDMEAGAVAIFSYSPARSPALRDAADPAHVIMRLDEQRIDTETAARSSPWRIRDADDLAEIAEFAGAPLSLPHDGRTLGWNEAEPLGQILIVEHDIREGGDVRFFDDGPHRTRAVEDISRALGIPGEFLAEAYTFNAEEVASDTYLLFPRNPARHVIQAPRDLYGRHLVKAEMILDLTAVHAFEQPEKPPILVLSVRPVEARIRESSGDDDDVLERFALDPGGEAPQHEILDVPPRYWLVNQIAKAFGVDPLPVISNRIEHPRGLDEFQEQERVDEMMALAAAPPADGAPDYWLTGIARLGTYDREAQAFPLSGLGVDPPHLLRVKEIERRALDTKLLNGDDLVVSIPEADAPAFMAATGGEREFPVRLRVRPRDVSISSYGNLYVRAAVIEGEILAPGAVTTVIDPAKVLYRFALEAPQAIGGATLRTREAAAGMIDEGLADLGDLVLVQRAGAGDAAPDMVLTDSVQTRDYVWTNEREGLEMPEDFRYGHAPEISEMFRANSNAALLLRRSNLLEMESDGEPSDTRQNLITLATEFDLQFSSYPPEKDPAGDERFQKIVPADAQYLIVRNRNDMEPFHTVYETTTDTVHYFSTAMFADQQAAKELKDAGFELPSLYPDSQAWIELPDVPDLLRQSDGIALVVKPEALRKVMGRMVDIDLVVRRFPLEKSYVSIPKGEVSDETFDILDVRLGMSRDEALAKLELEFGSDRVWEHGDGRTTAGAEDCLARVPPAQGTDDEAGRRCVAVETENGVVVQAGLRQVIRGDLEEQVLDSLKRNYGWNSGTISELRHLEAGGRRHLLGWGMPFRAEREILGRVDSRLPTTPVETVVWYANGLTSVAVQLAFEPEAQGTAQSHEREETKIEF